MLRFNLGLRRVILILILVYAHTLLSLRQNNRKE